MRHVIRPALPEHLGFVVKPWLQELRRSSTTRYLTDRVFFQEHGHVVNNLLATCRVDLACDPDDESHFYGFVAYAQGEHECVVHWLYVKSAFRQLGIGRALYEHATHGARAIASHVNDFVMGPLRSTWEKYGLTYNPYVLRGAHA